MITLKSEITDLRWPVVLSSCDEHLEFKADGDVMHWAEDGPYHYVEGWGSEGDTIERALERTLANHDWLPQEGWQLDQELTMGTNAMLVLGFATEQTHISSRTDPEAEEIRWLKTFATIELGNPPEEYWEEVQRAADKDRLFRYFYYAPGADGEREVDVLDDAYGQPFRPLDYWQVVKILKAERQIVDYRRYKPAVELLEHAHGLTWETCPLILIHHGH